MLSLLLGLPANHIEQQTLTLISQPKPPPAIVQTLSLEEKIQTNYYKCDETTHFIRADTATCLRKLDTNPSPNQKAVKTAVRASKRINRTSHAGNTYTAGQCTWFVKNKAAWVPNGWGNANQWAYNAAAAGFTVSNQPVVGAVAQTSRGEFGHVAIVIAVRNNLVTIQEMNYKGSYITSTRTVPSQAFRYIY